MVLKTDNGVTLNTLTKYVMVESPSYFEAYRHVLKALQGIKKENLPFQKYLLGSHCIIEKPTYLKYNTTLDLSPLMKDKFKLG